MKWSLSFCLLWVAMWSSAQDTDPVIIAPQGGFTRADGFDISWTIGDLVTETAFLPASTFTQGFQQPRLLVKPVPVTEKSGFSQQDDPSAALDIQVYPNPFGTHLCFDAGRIEEDYIIDISDASGRHVLRVKGSGPVEPVFLNDYPASTYSVRFSVPARKQSQSFQVIKSQ